MDVHWGRGQHSENLGPQVRASPPPPHTHITLLTDIHVDIENKQISGNAYSYIFLVDAYIFIIFF